MEKNMDSRLYNSDTYDNHISTAAMSYDLLQAEDIDDYLERNRDNMLSADFSNYLNNLLNETNTSIAEVVRGSGLDRTYTYQIFNGRKKASRDHLIAIAFGFGLDLEETQKMLKASGNRELYVRDERDAIIFLAVRDRKTVTELNIDLYENGLETLTDKKHN